MLETPFWVSSLAPVAASIAAWAGCVLAFSILRRMSKKAGSDLAHRSVQHLRRPVLLLAPVLALRVSLPLVALSGGIDETVRHSVAMLLILGTGRLLIALTSVLDDFLDKRFALDVADNLTARRPSGRCRHRRRGVGPDRGDLSYLRGNPHLG